MKKISLLVALAIILAVAAPVFAGPFSDVPVNHWAYQALEKVAATGIVTGYQDGTFRGSNTLTRYEIAVVVSRILDKVAAERALLAEKVDALENGLTAGQAEDTIAIFKSLLAKEREKMIAEIKASLPAQPGQTTTETVVEKTTELVLPENLTEAQAAEVAAIVEALSMEFKFELAAIGARLDAMEADFGGRLTALEAASHSHSFTWTANYGMKYTKTNIDGTAYKNPFDLGAGKYTTDNDLFRQTLNLGFNGTKGDLSAAVTLSTVKDNFGTWSVDADSDYNPAVEAASGKTDTLGLSISGFNANLTNGKVNVAIANDQEVVLEDFLFGAADEPYTYDGVVATSGNNTYVLARTKDANTSDNELVMDADDHDAFVADYQGLGMGIEDMFTGSDADGWVVDESVTITKAQYDSLADVAHAKNYALYRSLVVATTDVNGNPETYKLAKNTEEVTNTYTVREVVALKQDLGLLNTNFFYGGDQVLTANKSFVAGLNSDLNILGFGLNTTFAFSDTKLENKLIKVSADRAFGPLELAGSYRKVDTGFTGVQVGDDFDDTSGYDASAKLALGSLTVEGSYATVVDDETVINAGAEIADLNLASFTVNVDGGYDMRTRAADDKTANRMNANVELSNSFIGIDLTAGYKYDKFTDYDTAATDFDGAYGSKVKDYKFNYTDNGEDFANYRYDVYGNKLYEKHVWSANDQFNNVYGNLAWKTFIPGLSLNADYVYGLSDIDDDGKGLSTHAYSADFAMSIFNAGASLDLVEDETILNAGLEYSIFKAGVEKVLDGDLTVTASVNPEAYTVAGISLDSYADVKMVNKEFNYDLGVAATKTIDALTLKAGYDYADHKITEEDVNVKTGVKKEINASADYKVTDSVTLNVKYVNSTFTGLKGWVEDTYVPNKINEVDAADYAVQQLTAGLSFSF